MATTTPRQALVKAIRTMRALSKCLAGSDCVQHCVNRSGAGRIVLVDGVGRPVRWERLVTGGVEINNPHLLGRGWVAHIYLLSATLDPPTNSASCILNSVFFEETILT